MSMWFIKYFNNVLSNSIYDNEQGHRPTTTCLPEGTHEYSIVVMRWHHCNVCYFSIVYIASEWVSKTPKIRYYVQRRSLLLSIL